MYFGAPDGISALAQRLRESGQESDATIAHTHRAMATLPDQVDHYQRASAHAYQESWGRAHDVLQSASDATDAIATALSTLAGALTNAQDDWNSGLHAATACGCAVHDAAAFTTVTAAASGAKPADHDAEHQAAVLQTRLRAAVNEAVDARITMQQHLDSASTPGLDDFNAPPASVAMPSTGDSGLDADVTRCCAQLLGLHDQINAHRAGR